MHNKSSDFDQFHVRRDRMFHISRWRRPTIASSVALAVLALVAALTSQAMAAGKTITAVMHSDLRIIDPGFTTAYITRDHGYMVYDTLLATDSNFKIQPQMAEQFGSGPFKFVAAEFQPGVKAVYQKNADYVPRKEAPSWTSGGKVVKVDRVEWITMPDAQTAVNALQSGDIDFMENPPFDLLSTLTGNKDLKVEILNKLGFQTLGRMNFLYPPFANLKVPPAAFFPINQKDVLD